METLVALVLICNIAVIGDCNYHNADRVIRAPGEFAPIPQQPGMPAQMSNIHACHNKGADAAKSITGLALDQVASHQCVPKSEADAIAR